MNHKARYARISNLINVEVLFTRRVLIIGLGSMGQPIVNQLVRHGVATKSPGRMRLIDGDMVTERNLIGTEYRFAHLNEPKASAAAGIVHEINPEVNLTYWSHIVTDQDIPAIFEMAGQSDLIGLFADSFEIMLRISEYCFEICPQVLAVFGPNADYAEIGFSIPGQTPPLSRIMGNRKREALSSPNAFGCDTAFIANMVASLCLELLVDAADRGKLLKCYADAPLLLAGLRKSWIFENEPDDVARIVSCVHVT